MARSSETIAFRIDFLHADRRLELMEEWARGAIRDKQRMATIVKKVEPPKPPILLPTRWAGILWGPDGKPLKET